MANIIMNDTHLTNIANAIRTKDGTTENILLENMASKIASIPSGGAAEQIEIPISAFSPVTHSMENWSSEWYWQSVSQPTGVKNYFPITAISNNWTCEKFMKNTGCVYLTSRPMVTTSPYTPDASVINPNKRAVLMFFPAIHNLLKEPPLIRERLGASIIGNNTVAVIPCILSFSAYPSTSTTEVIGTSTTPYACNPYISSSASYICIYGILKTDGKIYFYQYALKSSGINGFPIFNTGNNVIFDTNGIKIMRRTGS